MLSSLPCNVHGFWWTLFYSHLPAEVLGIVCLTMCVRVRVMQRGTRAMLLHTQQMLDEQAAFDRAIYLGIPIRPADYPTIFPQAVVDQLDHMGVTRVVPVRTRGNDRER